MSSAMVPSVPQILDLIEHVEQAVQTKTGGRIVGLRVRIDEGCLVISGKTTTYYNKQLVTHAVRDAVDDMTVQNDVIVGR